MLFNSYEFIFIFLPITIVLFFGLIKIRSLTGAKVWLLLSSLFFYGYWKITYLPLLLFSVIGNYYFGKYINYSSLGSKKAKVLLVGGICFNLIILGYYKYANFFLTSFNQIFHTSWVVPEILLPLAISFYSFTQIAYLVDAYHGQTKDRQYNLLDYTLFVTVFPQLIAGPILRHDELIPQFKKLNNFIFNHKNMAIGITWFTLGLAKKVLIADKLSPWVEVVFSNADGVTFIEAWIGALSYTFQLYFDFSGYSDMAIGLGWMLNISLPINFNSPYKAISISDFWRRWHITLSNFLRDYLYIPLGGNRKGKIRQYTNLLVTMLLGGLWHGAGWTYIIWGGMHGLFLIINHSWRKLGITLPKILGWLITFNAVIFSWVLFRASSLSDAMSMLQTMLGMKGIVLLKEFESVFSWLGNFGVEFKNWRELAYLPPDYKTSLIILLLTGIVAIFLPNTQQIMQKFKPTWWATIAVSAIAVINLLLLNRVSEFLYFQF
ncbi:MAG: MBOAT family protein [Xenococcaceae cyanobacterium MO_188.B32]|nr:MBOAT family protein [Xenococcaceae cyanobacterium MO_188.B32]